MKEIAFSIKVYWGPAEHSVYIKGKKVKMVASNHRETLMLRKGTWILLGRQREMMKTPELRIRW